MSAESIAASTFAPPMAIPTSDAARAGASFMPSPTMATRPYVSLVCVMILNLSSGKSSAYTSSTSKVWAISSAISVLSPVKIAVYNPAFFRAFTV